ncbi:MAG TPA: hypothetical protein VLL06_03215, partial [Nitrospiraceae bacterium]|nr:hypothetical protein [Nitrospiraceae bacterium]
MGKVGMKIKESQYRGFVLEPAAVNQAKVDDYTGALETVTKIPNSDRAVLALADIAFIQTTKGHKQQGARTFRQAHARAAVLKDRNHKALVLGKIAELEGKSHDANASKTLAEALQIVTGLPLDDKPDVLYRLGFYQFGAGQVEAVETLKQASQALSLISDNRRKWMTAFQLAPLQIQVGDKQGALVTARLCVDEQDFYCRSYLLSSVAVQQAEKGMISEALETLSEVPNETEKQRALGAIVKAHLKNGDLQEASRLTETI